MRAILSRATLIALFLSGCPDPGPEVSSDATLDGYFEGLAQLPEPPEPPEEPIVLEAGRNPVFIGRDKCSTSRYRQSATPTSVTVLNPNGATLYPGNLVTGQSAQSGVLVGTGLDLAPQTIVVTAIGTDTSPGATYQARIARPSASRTNEAIQKLLRDLDGITVPARISHVAESYYSVEHAALLLNASASAFGGSVTTTLELDNSFEQNHVLLALVQGYYDISIEQPTRGKPREFLDPLHVDDLADALKPEPVMPAYVETVTYGRIILVSASSSFSASALRLAVNAAADFVIGNGSVDLTVDQRNVLTQSDFRLLGLGGAGSHVINATGLDGLDSLKAVYRAGANWSTQSPGLPISYKLSWLGSNEVARIGLVSDYDVRECNPQRITAVGFKFNTRDDNKDGGDLVRVDVLLGNQGIASDPEVGLAHHEWDDDTWQPGQNDGSWGLPGWFVLPLPGPTIPTVGQCTGLTLRISKNGGKGWRFAPYMMGVIEDGTTLSFPIPSLYFPGGTPWQLGNGQTSTRDFQVQGC